MTGGYGALVNVSEPIGYKGSPTKSCIGGKIAER